MRGALLFCTIFLTCQLSASAVEYYCVAFKQTYSHREYTKEELKKKQFATRLEDFGTEAYISRCSYSPSDKKVTCDRYKVDRIEHDKDSKIKKYYVFRYQFNFQLFPSLAGIEDNGRGAIQFSKCEVVSP